jgi:hypothetical protein
MQTLKTLLIALRLKLRPYWLVAKRDLKTLFTACQKCKALGVYPCSIAGCVPLCTSCQREESIRLDMRLRMDKAEAALRLKESVWLASQRREDLIILTASILYTACPAITEAPQAVAKAMEIEGEVKRHLREKERRDLPADFRDHLPSALQYAKDRLAAAQPDIITGKTIPGEVWPYPEK